MSEELEVVSGDYDDDYWYTYQYFFLNDDGVEITEELIIMSPDNSRVEIASGEASLVLVANCSHDIISSEIELLDEYTVHAEDCYHNVINTDQMLAVQPDDCSDDITSDDVWLLDEYTVHANDCYHDILSDGDLLLSGVQAVAADSSIILHYTDGNISLTPSIPVSAQASVIFVDSPDVILADATHHVINPDNSASIIDSSVVAKPIETEFIRYVNNGLSLLTSDEIQDIPTNYVVVADVSSCDIVDKGPVRLWDQTMQPQDSTIAIVSDDAWNWIDAASHAVISAKVPVSPYIYAQGSIIRFTGQSSFDLGISVSVDSCSHSIFTPDVISPDDSDVVIASDKLGETAGNIQYRRLYV